MLYSSHECLLLPFEEQFTNRDKESGEWFDRSAHMLWVGERTRQLDGAHTQFAKGISNPIGVKVSEKCSAEELVQMLRTLNPRNAPGRISIITRMGASGTYAHLPVLIRAVQSQRLHVLWVCDPMHGNTVKTDSGLKTRHLDSIRAEIKAFFDVHRELGSHPGGVHLELTSGDVTECVGGDVGVERLADRYHTACDPRLNREQSLEIAFFVADLLRHR
jgi:3-deoxy-7-phosphoheptulonate synthase